MVGLGAVKWSREVMMAALGRSGTIWLAPVDEEVANVDGVNSDEKGTQLRIDILM